MCLFKNMYLHGFENKKTLHIRPNKIDSLSQHLLQKWAMPYTILYIYIFKILFSVKLTLMPRTLRTYFDPNNHNARKGKTMKYISFKIIYIIHV